jgi:uncharacterized membrane protein
MNRLRAVRSRGDEGQLLLLVLAYAVIAGLLITVVVNLSKAYLYRRALVAAVDGAALTAANQPDLDRLYSGGAEVLPLSEVGARSAVRQYVRDADLARRFDGFQVLDVSTDGQTVTVRLGSVARMPFINVLSSNYADGYPIEATARARSPLVP